MLQLLLEHVPGLLFVKDHRCRIVSANRNFLNLYPPEMQDQIIGYTTFEAYPQDQSDRFLFEDRRALEHGLSEVVETIDFPDGKRRTLLTRKVGKTRQDGSRYLIGVSTDITEMVEQRAQLSRQNTVLSEFAYRVSHDLRSPVLSALALLRLTQAWLADNNIPDAQDAVGRTVGVLTRAEALASDLLRLTRIEELEPSVDTFDALALLNDVVAAEKQASNAAHVRIDVHVALDRPITTDAERFRWIAENLISNSIKYHDPDSADPFVRVELRESPGGVELRCEDNGLGVPEKYRLRLFGMFERFHVGFAEGSGLGLHMVQRSAQHLGGNALYEPRDPGAAFIVRLSEDPRQWS